ncbi:hypothetical protein OS493_037520 [Desmophyllum pertusum]|uniref:Uncharacterized protein n=1 Tax=Desmophyllum pertusum TaxID=174260 RepID=A0A9X0D5U8_9CNID|nr:hypothetical protein OS493_037520 [Desmophyllum pertusum]
MRKQLRIVLDALDDAMEYLLRVNTRSARRTIGEIQELKHDIITSLNETSELMRTSDEAGGSIDLRSPAKKSLEAIVNEAEYIRRTSHNLSAEMKSELHGLKANV